MKDLLELIIKNITLHPDEVVIDEQDSGDSISYTIHVHAEDMGRVIGKAGKVIKAIRSLMHVAGIRNNMHYRVNVAESGDNPQQPIDSSTETEPEKPESTDTGEAVSPTDDTDIIAQALDTEEE